MDKKRLLYVAPNHLDFYKVILNGLEHHSNYQVTLLLSTYKYEYKNFGERLLNLFFKIFLKKNLKKIKFEEYYRNQLNNYDDFDVLLINRADIFPPNLLELITKKAKYSIVNYWDSFDKIKGQKETIKYFDKCYSFDKNDCLQHNLNLCSNFYFVTDSTKQPEYDVFYLATYDNRFEDLKKIYSVLKNLDLKIHAKLLSKDKNIIKKNETENISFFSKTIPFSESYVYNQNTKVILDIAHHNQTGLSFRPFEAIGLKKKLITTNSHIEEYDFYNPNNIFIWKEDTVEIPKSFFETKYEDLPIEVFEKYSLKNWINEIIP